MEAMMNDECEWDFSVIDVEPILDQLIMEEEIDEILSSYKPYQAPKIPGKSVLNEWYKNEVNGWDMNFSCMIFAEHLYGNYNYRICDEMCKSLLFKYGCVWRLLNKFEYLYDLKKKS